MASIGQGDNYSLVPTAWKRSKETIGFSILLVFRRVNTGREGMMREEAEGGRLWRMLWQGWSEEEEEEGRCQMYLWWRPWC